MTVSRVNYCNWRNIENCSIPLDGGINVLWGMNAQGKSNILEGVYYFARGRSFRSAHERDLVRFGCDFASASLDFRRDGYVNDTNLTATIPYSGKKTLMRNGAPLSSAAEMIGCFRAVLFTPANLSVVTGGPGERRSFLDIALSQLSGAYLSYLRRYAKYLGERNALIKRARDGGRVTVIEWETYAKGLAECGAWIASYRKEYVGYLNDAVVRYFSGMMGDEEMPDLIYVSHCNGEDLPAPLLGDRSAGELKSPDGRILYEKLTGNTEREIAAGTTLWGVHKDDILLNFNGREAKVYASQGQQRSIVLSMKLAEAEIAYQAGGEYPVILLDDVFSELDERRRRYILDSLGTDERRQIIVTSCEPDIIPGARQSDAVFHRVSEGRIV